MSELQPAPKGIQWKWVWISLLMYLLFYFLPLALVPGGIISGAVVTKSSAIFIGLWSFAGLIIIAAIAGFLSEGVTVREPALAAIGVMILWVVSVQMRFNSAIRFTFEATAAFVLALFIVGLLALGGAWFGEQLQKVFKAGKPE